MQLSTKIIPLKKRYPLTISRGTHTGSDNLFVRIEDEGHVGFGEMCPGTFPGDLSAVKSQQILKKFWDDYFTKENIENIWSLAKKENLPGYVIAALDIALWDLRAKKQGKSIREIIGLPLPQVPTSMTLGMMPPQEIKRRIPLLFGDLRFKSIKIKLGSSRGIEADKAMFEQAMHSTEQYELLYRVDANGGWNVEDAKRMSEWLANRRVDYIEQPLAKGEEENLRDLYASRSLPIYVDESCHFVDDLDHFSDNVDGVNIKLMKCGGITGALQILEKCKEIGLKTMIGCMGESSIAISAASQISGAIDHIDLDSHFNLDPDPAEGAILIDGVLTPNELPGHGAKLIHHQF